MEIVLSRCCGVAGGDRQRSRGVRQEWTERTERGNCRNSLVGAVDVVDGQNGQVAVVTEVTQGDAATGLQLQSIDFLLGNVEGDGHGEDIAIGKAVVSNDTGGQKSC